MPPKRSLLACAWPVAEPVFEGVAVPEDDSVTAANTQAPFVLKRLAAGWTPPAPPPAAAWTPPPEGREERQVEFSWAGETARHVGTVVHRWLQRIAEDELKAGTRSASIPCARISSATSTAAASRNRAAPPNWWFLP